jgi:demethylmenaquinone methyltransferase/2-methoxy-6-polyprenyl-1,4-benzoquinol methylase
MVAGRTETDRSQGPRVTDISKSPAKIAGMFDAIAGRYDFLNRVLSAGIDRRWRKRAIASLDLTGRERVLDLCTGTGDLALAAVDARPGARRVVGIDFAGAMLAIGRDKVRARALTSTVSLVRGDATRVPVADASVDAVTVAFGIRNVEHTAGACAEMHRVLTPGGRLAVLEFAMPQTPVIGTLYRWYFNTVLPAVGRLISKHNAAYGYLPASVSAFASPSEFEGMLQRAGFADVRSRPLTFGIVNLYTARKR